MLVAGIKSRPVYRGLRPDLFAKQNIVVTDAAGCEPVLDMMKLADEGFPARPTILLCGTGGERPSICHSRQAGQSKDPRDVLNPLGFANIWSFPTSETATSRLNAALNT